MVFYVVKLYEAGSWLNDFPGETGKFGKLSRYEEALA